MEAMAAVDTETMDVMADMVEIEIDGEYCRIFFCGTNIWEGGKERRLNRSYLTTFP